MVMGSIKTGTDVLVIGAGPGGYVAAARAGHLGLDVTLVEAGELGGVCLNEGCIPSKALIAAANIVHHAREAADRGIHFTDLRVDMEKLQEWKDKVIRRLVSGVAYQQKQAQVNVVRGRARFEGPHDAVVEGPDGLQAFHFKYCIIATGSQPVELPFLKFDGERVLQARDALNLREVPEHLVVVGGGYIGLELGIVYRKLGAQVTVVEMMDQILPGTDPDLVNVLMRKLRRLGVTVHTRARARGLVEEGGRTVLQVEASDGQVLSLPADKVLVSVGRKPNTEGLNLAAAGVELDDRGFIKTDEQCRTNVPHIFAIGDVAGGMLLAHKASHEGLVAAEAIAGKPAAKDWVSVPAVVFTDPEIAYVGLTEQQAREQGYEVQVGRFQFTASGRALTLGETDGLVKIVADAKTGVVLGVQMAGPEVSEMISEAALALEMGALVEDIARTIHPHPTLSEGIMEAAQAIFHAADRK
ncbi:MAG: dihydrolipoyl dehydrogenase [Bacillota bacterium]